MPNSTSGSIGHKQLNAIPEASKQNDVSDKWLNEVAFNSDGLIPAIAKDKASGEILMMAWMNREALKLTVSSKTAVYYSRSRNRLWKKGETSGHTQIVHDIFLDCDADALVLTITQVGNIACHTGRKSCFYRQLDLSSEQPTWQTIAPIIKNPEDIYGNKADSTTKSVTATNSMESSSCHLEQVDALSILSQLDRILGERKQADADSSYVASLYAKGINKILEKVGEEAVETIIAAKDLAATAADMSALTDQYTYPAALVNDLVYEIADVWFHTVVTLAWFNVGSDRVLAELASRFGLSGIDEKNSRTSS